MSKSIVTPTLLCVCQHAVSFRGFFEFFFGGGVVRILIRVMTHGQPAIRALYFLICRVTGNAQYLVIISFAHPAFLKPFVVIREPLAIGGKEGSPQLSRLLGTLGRIIQGRTHHSS